MYSIIQGNKHKKNTQIKRRDFKIHEAVQNVTPIKYHVFKSKTDPEEKKIQTYKSKPYYKITPDQPHSDLNYIE